MEIDQEVPEKLNLSKILQEKPNIVAAGCLKQMCDGFILQKIPAHAFLLDIFDSEIMKNWHGNPCEVCNNFDMNLSEFDKGNCADFYEFLEYFLGSETDISSVNSESNIDLLNCYFAGGVSSEEFTNKGRPICFTS